MFQGKAYFNKKDGQLMSMDFAPPIANGDALAGVASAAKILGIKDYEPVPGWQTIYFGSNHQVTPKNKALSCANCHALNGVLDFKELGYSPKEVDKLTNPELYFEKLLKLQQKDFEGIFKAMDGLPVTVRLLDPPLHEFVPHTAKDQAEMAKRLNVPAKQVADRVRQLHEFNPMLGHRGCRLSVTYPELCVMQTTAIIAAAIPACSSTPAPPADAATTSKPCGGPCPCGVATTPMRPSATNA